MQAMTFMAPPQPLQVSMSILKTRLSRCAHVIDARRCAGVAGSSATLTLLPLPRFAGVTNARCRLLGANTPWKRVRLTLGFGTRGGQPVDGELLQFLSPLGWEHINLTGDYVWRQSRRLEDGKFRPLRMPGKP